MMEIRCAVHTRAMLTSRRTERKLQVCLCFQVDAGTWGKADAATMARRKVVKVRRGAAADQPTTAAAPGADGNPFAGVSLAAAAPSANPFAGVSLTAAVGKVC